MSRLDEINALIDEFWEDGVFEERERREVYRAGKRMLLSKRRIEDLIEAGRLRAEQRLDDKVLLHQALRNSIEFMLSASATTTSATTSDSVYIRWTARKQKISASRMARSLGLNAGQLEQLEDHIKTWSSHPNDSNLKLMAAYQLGACICRLEAKSRRNYKLIWSPSTSPPDLVGDLRRLVHNLEDMLRDTLYELVGGKRRMADWIEDHFPKEAERWAKKRGPHGILQELYFFDLFRILLHPEMRKDTERVFKKEGVLAFGGSVNRSLSIIGADCNTLRNKAAHGKEINHYDLPRLHLYYDAIVDQLNAARNRGEIDVNTGSNRKSKKGASTVPTDDERTPTRSRWKMAAILMATIFLLFEGWQHRHLIPIQENGNLSSSTVDPDESFQTTIDSLLPRDSATLSNAQFNPWDGSVNNASSNAENNADSRPIADEWKPVAKAVWENVVMVNENGTALWTARCTSTMVETCRWLTPDGTWLDGRTVEVTLNDPGSYEVLLEVQANGYNSILTLPFDVISPKENLRGPSDLEVVSDSNSPAKSTPTADPCNGEPWGTEGNPKTILMDAKGWIQLYETPSTSSKPTLMRTGTEVEILEKKGKFRLVRTCDGQAGYVRKQQLRD